MLEPSDCDMVTPRDSPVTPQVCNTVMPEEQLCYQSSWTTCTSEILIQKLCLVKWETDCSISLCNAHVMSCDYMHGKRFDISWLPIWEFKAKWRQVKRLSPGIKLRTPDLCSYCSATELWQPDNTILYTYCTGRSEMPQLHTWLPLNMCHWKFWREHMLKCLTHVGKNKSLAVLR